MMKQMSVPTGVILTERLKELDRYLSKNYSYRPDGTMPTITDDKEREAYRDKVAEYKVRLADFNSGVKALTEKVEQDNRETVSKMMSDDREGLAPRNEPMARFIEK